jgi:hypothetical protein
MVLQKLDVDRAGSDEPRMEAAPERAVERDDPLVVEGQDLVKSAPVTCFTGSGPDHSVFI